MNHPEANDNQQGYHSQQIEIYGVFESKHGLINFFTFLSFYLFIIYGSLRNTVIRNRISSSRRMTAAMA